MSFSISRTAIVRNVWQLSNSRTDYEIFSLRDEVALHEGEGVTFYDFVGVQASASQAEVNKALKKQSRTLHPDKVKQQLVASESSDDSHLSSGGGPISKKLSDREVQNAYNKANERYARLVLVANILQGEDRVRYDHFLANGFPKWRGTGYYYARFRPGLGTVLVGLFVVMGGAAHYGALILGWKRQRSFIDNYIRQARRNAWGDETGIRGIPGVDTSLADVSAGAPQEPDNAAPMNRRQKRILEKEGKREKPNRSKSGGKKVSLGTATQSVDNGSPSGEKKRVVAENGKVLIVDSVGNVFLEQEGEDGYTQEFLLDLEEIPKPTIKDTALFRLPAWIVKKTMDSARNIAPSSFSSFSSSWSKNDGLDTSTGQPQQSQESDPSSGFELISNDSPVDMMAQATSTAKRRTRKGKN